MAKNSGKTVREILRTKRAVILRCPLDPGSPSWDDIMDMTWEVLEKRKQRGEVGFQAFHKLLTDGRFNK